MWTDRLHLAATVAMAIVLTAVLVGRTTDDGIVLGNDLAPLRDTRVLQAEQIARTIFGDVCHGQVAVTVAPMDGNKVGQASWTPDGVYSNCSIIIGSGRDWSFPMLCAVVVHEYGHLAGVQHSANRTSVMFPRLSAQNIPARCRIRPPIA